MRASHTKSQLYGAIAVLYCFFLQSLLGVFVSVISVVQAGAAPEIPHILCSASPIQTRAFDGKAPSPETLPACCLSNQGCGASGLIPIPASGMAVLENTALIPHEADLPRYFIRSVCKRGYPVQPQAPPQK